jgi:hypothetical protein
MNDPEGELIFEAYAEPEVDVREVSSDEIEKVIDARTAYYGDLFLAYKGYYLVGYEEREPERSVIHWQMYSPSGEKIKIEGKLDPQHFKGLVDVKVG